MHALLQPRRCDTKRKPNPLTYHHTWNCIPATHRRMNNDRHVVKYNSK